MEDAEEVALLGQTVELGSSDSSSNDSIDTNVLIVKAEVADTPTDDSSSSLGGDISLMERPLPLGAEDS